MKIYRVMIILILISNSSIQKTNGQTGSSYQKYDFEEFLSLQTTSAEDYVKVLYKKIRYPELKLTKTIYEGEVKVKIVNHSMEHTEIIILNGIEGYNNNIRSIVNSANKKYLIKTHEKYETQLRIVFDFEPLDPVNKDDNSIRISKFKCADCGLTNIRLDIPNDTKKRLLKK